MLMGVGSFPPHCWTPPPLTPNFILADMIFIVCSRHVWLYTAPLQSIMSVLVNLTAEDIYNCTNPNLIKAKVLFYLTSYYSLLSLDIGKKQNAYF